MGALIPQIAPAALFAYAWQGSAIPLAVPLAAQGYRIAQWRPRRPGRGCSRPCAPRRVGSIQPPSASSSRAASATSVRSSPRRPTSCTPTGRP